MLWGPLVQNIATAYVPVQEDFVESFVARTKDLEQRQKELQEKQEKDELKSRAPLDACELKLKEYQEPILVQEVLFCTSNLKPLKFIFKKGFFASQEQLMDLDSYNINHIIIAVDNSGSMNSGTVFQGSHRWTCALQAVDAFRKALVSRGSPDKVRIASEETQQFWVDEKHRKTQRSVRHFFLIGHQVFVWVELL